MGKVHLIKCFKPSLIRHELDLISVFLKMSTNTLWRPCCLQASISSTTKPT